MTENPKGGRQPAENQAQHSSHLEQRFQKAVVLHHRGLLSQAQSICEEIFKAQPERIDNLHLLGICLAQRGEHRRSLELLSAAIGIDYNHPPVHNDRGTVLAELKRFEEALASFDEAIRLKPDFVEAHNNRGNVLRSLKRFEEALASYDQAIRLKPDFAQAHNNRGAALVGLRRFEEALASYDQAIRLKPDFAEAYNNLGITNALRDLKRFELALVNFDHAIHLKPGFAEAHNNRGAALVELKRFEKALVNFDHAIRLKPDFAKAYNNRGAALVELKRFEEALASYDQAFSLKPDHDWLFGNRAHTAFKLCLWDSCAASVEFLSQALQARRKVSTPFVALGLIDNPALQKACAEIYSQEKFPRSASTNRIFSKRSHNKFRIGYFSADFHNHATLYLMAEMFELHDRSRFELYGFSFGPPKNDQMRQRVSSLFNAFYDVNDQSDSQVAELSRRLGIDIAVDLKGYTHDARTGIFAESGAPIQVNYLGYPGTMGTYYHDYIVADHTLIPPESQPFYSEKVVYLPHSYQVNDSKRRISDKVFTRQELGLPESGFVFCCFNINWKILPEVLDLWMHLLKNVRGSVFWLFEDNRSAAKNLRKEADDRGVDSKRLLFAPRMPPDEHLARHRCADLFLDTLPCNAHTTASDALWAGLPVLTRIGQSFAGRVAASLLTAMDLSELVAHSPEEYKAKALELALNPEKLAVLKAKIAANRQTSPLFNAKLFTRDIEAAYTEMIRRHDAGLAPANIEVSKEGLASSSDG